jgi:ribosomal-protein-alanine N-acetyltransferase
VHIPTLQTDRLELQPFTRSHSAGMYKLWSSQEVCRYSGPATDFQGEPIDLPAKSAADSDRILDFFMRRARAGTGLRWAMVLRERALFAGALGFNSLGTTEHVAAEIAYHLHPDHWRQGLMGEACTAVISWAASALPCQALEAFVEPANAASIKLLHRLHFLPTGENQDGADRYLLASMPAIG